MAVWQFKVALVPKRWLDAGGSIAFLITDHGWDTAPTWESFDDQPLEDRITAVLPAAKSWHPSVAIWGADDRDDIQLSRNNGRVESLSVRFDLRNPNMALFRAIVDLAQASDLVILDLARRRVVRDSTELLRAAAESEAAHFVLDPLSFLSEIDVNARPT